MIRFFLFALVIGLFCSCSTLAQDTSTSPPEVPELEAPELVLEEADFDEIDLDSTDFNHLDLLQQMSELYAVEADILDAEVREDHGEREELIDMAVEELVEMLRNGEVLEDPRFRELYRTIITEFEAYYGVEADTLTLPRGSIFDVRDEMFTMLDEGVIESITLPELKPMTTTIPMDVNRLVEQSITYLMKYPEKTIDLWRVRAQTYFPMIEQVLREEGLPDEMKYLAMIESGLVPTARSWARANGMWQFIAATGRSYGLQTNHWVDERLDPEKATRAAARHLKDLYEMFGGDWHLAMAGYNCSPGRIRRAIRQVERTTGRKATFWDIYRYIPRETRNYVPMFIAASLVVSNEESFELKPVEPGPRYEYEFVPIAGMIELSEAAEMAGTDVETLRILNPELRTSLTPPVERTYPLRVPLGTGVAFMEAYTQRPHLGETDIRYTVRAGESLGQIAKRYGVSTGAIKRANQKRNSTLEVNETLVIPVERYASTTAPEIAGNAPTRVAYGTHSVYSVPITAMRGPAATSDGSLENLASHTQETAAKAKARAATTPKPKPQTTSTRTASANENRVRHRVRRGESLGLIAQRYGVSISQLREWNNIRGSKILIGQRLTIYTNGSAPVKTVQHHRVRKGDSLYVIARRYGVTITQIKQWNNLRSSVIRPGQRLQVSS